MKKKTTIILITIIGIIVFSVITVAAINGNFFDSFDNNTETNNNLEIGETLYSGEVVKMIKDSNAYNTPYEKLTPYSYDKFMFHLQHKEPSSGNHKVIYATSVGMYNLQSFNSMFPIEKLNVINDDCIYVEYKLEKDNMPIHAFVVLERSILNEDGKDFESWQYYGELYFAYPEIKSEQLFLLEGKRTAINDLPFSIDMRYTPCTVKIGTDSPLRFEETILVNDGFMVINYIADSWESKEIEITDMTFIPYGQSDENYLGNSFVKNSFSVMQ